MVTLGIILFHVIPGLILFEVLRYAYLEHRRDRIPILLYHRLISREEVRSGKISDHEPIFAIYDDRFESHMQYLHDQGCSTLHLGDLKDIREGRLPRPPKPVLITFDDGYESNYRYAWPALRKLSLKATIFVAPDPDQETRDLVAGVDGFLNSEQMRILDQGGVRIESHTLTHRILSDLDDASVKYELDESKRRLAEILGRPVRHLAIPRAGYSRRVRRHAVVAGYDTVCCNNKGSSNGLSDLMALPRIVVERHMTAADLGRALEPRAGIILRLTGNLKRLPARLLGPAAAGRIRHWLYTSPVGSMLQGGRLKRFLAGSSLAYLAGSVLFTWYLLAR